jgi:plasmid maintenance system antidote protein VapI
LVTTRHPGLDLKTLITEDYGLSVNLFAQELDFSTSYVNDVLNGNRTLSVEFALRVEGWNASMPSARTLLHQMVDHELDKAREKFVAR